MPGGTVAFREGNCSLPGTDRRRSRTPPPPARLPRSCAAPPLMRRTRSTHQPGRRPLPYRGPPGIFMPDPDHPLFPVHVVPEKPARSASWRPRTNLNNRSHGIILRLPEPNPSPKPLQWIEARQEIRCGRPTKKRLDASAHMSSIIVSRRVSRPCEAPSCIPGGQWANSACECAPAGKANRARTAPGTPSRTSTRRKRHLQRAREVGDEITCLELDWFNRKPLRAVLSHPSTSTAAKACSRR